MKLIIQILGTSLSLLGTFTTISNRLPYIKDVLGRTDPAWSRIKVTIKALKNISPLEDLKKAIDEGLISGEMEVNIKSNQFSAWVLRRSIKEKDPGFEDIRKMLNKHYLVPEKMSSPKKIAYGYIFYEDMNNISEPFLSFLNWLKESAASRKEEMTSGEKETVIIYDKWLKAKWPLYDYTMRLRLTLGKPVIPSGEKVIYYDDRIIDRNPNLDLIFDQYKNDILLFLGFILIFAGFIAQGIVLFLK